MKTQSLLSVPAMAFSLLAIPVMQARSIELDFFDLTPGEGDISFGWVGDLVRVSVIIDLGTGEYSSHWYSGDLYPYFFEPIDYVLLLGNTRTGEVVDLSHSITSWTIFGTRDFYGREIALTGWQDGDAIVTYGSGEAFAEPFVSGIFSTDPTITSADTYDLLEQAGIVEAPVGDISPVDPGPDEDLPEEPSDNEDDEPLDSDGDGIPDEFDLADNSDLGTTVTLLGQDTGITNNLGDLVVDENGMTLADIIRACEEEAAAGARNDGQYVQQLVKDFKLLEEAGWITSRERALLVKIVAHK